jgi:excisionase family DNA binding protein
MMINSDIFKGVIKMDKGVFSPEEAADYLGIHPQTVYKLLRNGELPGKKIGQLWRISKNSLTAYLEDGQTGSKVIPAQPLKANENDEPGSLITPGIWSLVGLFDRARAQDAPANVAEEHDRYLAEILEEESK